MSKIIYACDFFEILNREHATLAYPISIYRRLGTARHLFTFSLIKILRFYDKSLDRWGRPNMSSMDRGEDDLKENIKVDSGTEDELSVPTKLSGVTPRNSLAGKPSPTSLNPTPHANVRDTVGDS